GDFGWRQGAIVKADFVKLSVEVIPCRAAGVFLSNRQQISCRRQRPARRQTRDRQAVAVDDHRGSVPRSSDVSPDVGWRQSARQGANAAQMEFEYVILSK